MYVQNWIPAKQIFGNHWIFEGSFDVEMLYSPSGGMTFIEMIDGGKVLTTTIDPSGKSVHSRNIIVEGEILPLQYYGICWKR